MVDRAAYDVICRLLVSDGVTERYMLTIPGMAEGDVPLAIAEFECDAGDDVDKMRQLQLALNAMYSRTSPAVGIA